MPALLAAAMLATGDEALAERLEAWREAADRIGGRSARMSICRPDRRSASSAAASSAGCSASRRRSSAITCHIFDPARAAPRAQMSPPASPARPIDDIAALRDIRQQRRRRDLRIREFAGRAARCARRQAAALDPLARDRAGPREREGVHRRHAAGESRRGGRSTSLDEVDARARAIGAAAGPQDPALRL